MLHFGALEAGGTKMVCAVGNAQGQILERISLPTRDPENTMPEILAFFREKQVSAVGVGCFGPVDLDRNSPTYGNITSSPKLQWRNFPMLRRFREALGVPVGFDTDVNAAALGEAGLLSCDVIQYSAAPGKLVIQAIQDPELLREVYGEEGV